MTRRGLNYRVTLRVVRFRRLVDYDQISGPLTYARGSVSGRSERVTPIRGSGLELQAEEDFDLAGGFV